MMIYYAKITKQHRTYLVEFPDAPGCLTEGNNLNNAKANAIEALEGWLEARCDHNLDIPEPKKRTGRYHYSVQVSVQLEFAIALRKLRKRRKLTQSQVAKKLGISQQAYAKLETPIKSNPSLSTIQRLADALDADVDLRLIA